MIEPSEKVPQAIRVLFLNTYSMAFSLPKNIFLHLFIAALAFVLGTTNLILTSKVVEMRFQDYANKTSLRFQLTQKMTAPVYLVYELNGFHQNTFEYMNSLSRQQLRGVQVKKKQLETSCGTDSLYNYQFGVTKSYTGVKLKPNDIASPCGLIAKTFFNDSFQLYKLKSHMGKPTQIEIDEKNISWDNLRRKVYQKAANSESTQWIDPQNEHFINWMELSSMGVFKKLWGRIHVDLEPGNYQLLIANNYPAQNFQAVKTLILTTKSSFGGNDWFEGMFVVALGVMELLVATIVGLRHWNSQARLD